MIDEPVRRNVSTNVERGLSGEMTADSFNVLSFWFRMWMLAQLIPFLGV